MEISENASFILAAAAMVDACANALPMHQRDARKKAIINPF